MTGDKVLEHFPLRVVLNLSDPEFHSQAQMIQNQVEQAGAEFIQHNDQDQIKFLDRVSGYLQDGPIAVVDQGFVTGQAMMDALVKASRTTSAAVVSESPELTHPVRVTHKQIVSAGSSEHQVTNPNQTFLGFIFLSNDGKTASAIEQAKYYLANPEHKVNTTDLIVVALVRSACAISAIGVTGVCGRADSLIDLHSLQEQVDNQDEQDVRKRRALRSNDGFYSTFVLRKLSRRVSMLSIKRGWTPDQITLTSLVLALVVAGFFATGWLPLMIIGAIGVQVSIIIDCADGEVARFTGVSSQFGAWLDAATDRIKEYALYAGLAFGASHQGLNLWPLAMGLMILQTVRHMSDYNFHAVQVIRETSVVPLSLSERIDAPAVSLGTILNTSATLNTNTKIRWLKKVIHMPIGERWLVISIGAAFGSAAFALWTLLALGLVALTYTTIGRIMRSRFWDHPKTVSGCDVLERQIYPGLGVQWFWADNPHFLTGRFAWMAPALLRLFELGLVFAIAQKYPIAYLWMFAVAFHHYDALYRSLAGFEIPQKIQSQGLGFLGRSLVVIMTSLGFLVPLDVTLLIGGIGFTALFVGYASKQWMQQIR
jgi:phosphatidylglycerophosphate synthase